MKVKLVLSLSSNQTDAKQTISRGFWLVHNRDVKKKRKMKEIGKIPQNDTLYSVRRQNAKELVGTLPRIRAKAKKPFQDKNKMGKLRPCKSSQIARFGVPDSSLDWAAKPVVSNALDVA